MNLTGKQLIEQGIITGNIAEKNIQQHSVDLNLVAVERLVGNFNNHDFGIIYDDNSGGKTVLGAKETMLLLYRDTGETQSWFWDLKPGAYDITFAQGCKIPSDKRLFVRQRSSMLRNGALLHSSVFDAGFETKAIGTVMFLTQDLRIYKGARIATIYSSESNVVQNLYDGQWQGDKQRLK